ncbi:MAG TPA: hypothetical protein VI670_02965 [Thermoanaerobaculia bacterium]|jgi:hypothetical protein
MIDPERIEAALRRRSDVEPSPFFERRVMNEIRAEAPAPLAFPWRHLAAAVMAGAVAVTLGARLFPADSFAAAALLVCAASLAAVERVVSLRA